MNKTIDFYNSHAIEYFENTVGGDMSVQISKFLSFVPAAGRILDCGCGSGRDSKTFLDLGYDVTGIDGSEKLCRLAADYTGRAVICKDFSDIDYRAEFNGIWACASLLHLPMSELPGVIDKLQAALKHGGVLYSSFKYGSGERIDYEGKFYCDLNESSAGLLFGADAEMWCTTDCRGTVWLNIIQRYK